VQDQSPLLPADLIWEQGTPLSNQHKDFYFSLKNGLEETDYVFLQANDLSQRLLINEKSAAPPPPFTIVETGFGTGLNFLATWQLWSSIDGPKKPLHFISTEKYPLSYDDLKQCLSLWPQLESLSKQLLTHYPDLISGQHQLDFENGRVKLTLFWGDTAQTLSQNNFIANCWFLDGFSPSKNPSMWSDELFNQVALHSDSHTTFSTFTAASLVRKGLIKYGFKVHKQHGFGAKREMLLGTFPDNLNVPPINNHPAYWMMDELIKAVTNAPVAEKKYKDSLLYDVLVIGAGLSGLTTALTIAEQGLSVLILDENPMAVGGASGQRQLAMYAKLPTEMNKIAQFTTHCLSYSQRYFKQKENDNKRKSFWHSSGLIQLAWNEKEAIKQQKFLDNSKLPSNFIKSIDAKSASKLSGLILQQGGLYFPHCGWLSPLNFANYSLEHHNIKTSFNTHITDIKWEKDSKIWRARSHDNYFIAKNIVIANANQARSFEQTNHLPTKPLRGQVSSINSNTLNSSKTILCGEGYLCPSIEGWHHFGATFDLNNKEALILDDDQTKNIENIQNWLPGWLSNEHLKEIKKNHHIKDHAGLRCTTPDYIPIVGQVPDYSKMLERFEKLRVGANSCRDLKGTYLPNLFINIGHGSKGLITTPIAAELIRSHICGGAYPFNEQLRSMLSPARFIIKHLKQRKI